MARLSRNSCHLGETGVLYVHRRKICVCEVIFRADMCTHTHAYTRVGAVHVQAQGSIEDVCVFV